MSEPESLSQELKGFEASLAALVPSAAAVDRDRLMYEAGRASRASTFWPWTAAVLSTGSLCALLVMTFVTAAGKFTRGSRTTSDPAVTEEVIASAPPPVDPASYAHLRRFLADADLAAFDAAPPPAVAPDSIDRNSLLHELLN